MLYSRERAAQIVQEYNEGNCTPEQDKVYNDMVEHAQRCWVCFNQMPNPWCWGAFKDHVGIFAETIGEIDTTGACED